MLTGITFEVSVNQEVLFPWPPYKVWEERSCKSHWRAIRVGVSYFKLYRPLMKYAWPSPHKCFKNSLGTNLLSSFGESWTEMRLSFFEQSRDSLQELWCLGEAQSKAGLWGRHVPRSSVFIIEGFRGLVEREGKRCRLSWRVCFRSICSFDETETRGRCVRNRDWNAQLIPYCQRIFSFFMCLPPLSY